MVLYNETSGSSESKEIAERFKKAAEARGEAVILQPSNPDIDPEEMRKNAKENQVGVLVVIGGDGTIHHAVQNFKDTIRDYQIGIIPGGTVNNFARVLSIPLKEEDAFETILAGQTTPVDFGMVNQDVMISTLTIGLLADTAANVTQQEKQKYGPLAFTKQFFRLLMKKKKYKLKIEGNEAYLRHFAYTIFMDLIRDTWPFDYIQETEVAQTVQKMMAFFNVEVAETVTRRVKYMVAISKVRSAQGAEYRPSAEQETYLEGNKHYQAFIEEMTATTLFLNKNDLTFVYFFLLANDQFYQDEATAQAILAHFDETEAPVYMLTHLVQHFLLEEIHMTPQLEKIRPQIFYYLFATHLFAELYYVQNVKMYNVFWNKIKEKYPVLLAELIQGLNQLYEQTGNELFTNKEFLALRYSSVLALSNDLIHREQKIVLGLKSGLPVLEEERVKLSIENNFRRFYALEVLRYSEASKEEWQNIDLLLVTSLADVETGHPEIFLFSSELTFEQYNRLNQKIVKINEKRTTSL